jgi:hypothetical protein
VLVEFFNVPSIVHEMQTLRNVLQKNREIVEN